jgi:enamine deaminase RidA (YjgF/YER057c/UK114 family)
MSATRRTEPRRRGALRLVGPCVLELVASLHNDEEQTVDIRLTAKLAAAIARVDASLAACGADPVCGAATTTVTVDRATAERWNEAAWQAVGEGLVAPAEAQALSDQLTPRGAA